MDLFYKISGGRLVPAINLFTEEELVVLAGMCTKACPCCHGDGFHMLELGPFILARDCNTCEGTGEVSYLSFN